MKKLPSFSLALLLITYSTLGWVLSRFTLASNLCGKNIYLGSLLIKFDCQWLSLLLGLAFILLISEILASPLSNIRKGLVYSFSTDIRAFILVIVTAFFASILVIWIHVVAHALVLITAGLLVRLDMLTAGINDWQAFWILSTVSIAGLVIGWALHNILIGI